MRKNLGFLLVLLVGTSMFIGCALTQMSAVWKDPAYEGRPKKVLVYSMLRNPQLRRIFEDEFVAHFKYRRLDAVPGYQLIAEPELVQKEFLVNVLRSQGFDTLLLTRVTGTRSEEVQVPATTTTGGAYYRQPGYAGTYRDYYGAGYTTTYTTAYTVEFNYAMTETALFDVATEKMFWSASARTQISDKDQKMIKEYVGMMVERLEKSNILPR